MSQPEKIHGAIIAIMRAIGPIAKDSKNTQQNYNFRGVDQVYNALHPHLAEHGVYCTSEILEATHTSREVQTASGKKTLYHSILKMRFTYRAEDGSSVFTEVVGEGMDYSGDKASNKAMSVADKYALLQLLKIPTAMVDPDRPQHPAPPTNAKAPSAPPRVDRVQRKDLMNIVELWRSNNSGTPAEQLTNWAFFVSRVVGRDFTEAESKQPDAWTMSEFEQVRDAVNAEVNGDEIPY
jgi:hypothetical protein